MSRMSCAILAVCTLLALEPALPAQQEPNLVFNGDFERGADGWAASGDRRTVKQVLHVALGRKEGRCALLRCTEFEGGAPSRHAMLAQRDRIKVRKGYLYTLTFWAKGQAIEDYVVNVALQDTNGWHKLGLMSSFVPTGKWKRF